MLLDNPISYPRHLQFGYSLMIIPNVEAIGLNKDTLLVVGSSLAIGATLYVIYRKFIEPNWKENPPGEIEKPTNGNTEVKEKVEEILDPSQPPSNGNDNIKEIEMGRGKMDEDSGISLVSEKEPSSQFNQDTRHLTSSANQMLSNDDRKAGKAQEAFATPLIPVSVPDPYSEDKYLYRNGHHFTRRALNNHPFKESGLLPWKKEYTPVRFGEKQYDPPRPLKSSKLGMDPALQVGRRDTPYCPSSITNDPIVSMKSGSQANRRYAPRTPLPYARYTGVRDNTPDNGEQKITLPSRRYNGANDTSCYTGSQRATLPDPPYGRSLDTRYTDTEKTELPYTRYSEQSSNIKDDPNSGAKSLNSYEKQSSKSGLTNPIDAKKSDNKEKDKEPIETITSYTETFEEVYSKWAER